MSGAGHAADLTVVTGDSGATFVVGGKLNLNPGSGPAGENITDTRSLQVASVQLSGPVCGGVINGEPQPQCADQPATFEAAAIGTCPPGSFFDLGTWKCWSCPAGTTRTAAAVDSERACSKRDSTIAGGYKSATFVGPLCGEGSFYDPVRGGECWSCPTGYARTAAPVHAKNACLRTAGGQFTAATVVKQARCGAGEIQDLKVKGAQKASYGGGCWTCPKVHDRTVFPIDGPQACEASANTRFFEATAKAALTCPKQQIFDLIGLTQADINQRRLVNVKPVPSGTCWSCPTGYNRTTASVKSAGACRANTIGWYSQPFPEPGLFGLDGAADVLLEVIKDDPEFVRQALAEVAASAAGGRKSSAYTKAYAQEKELLATQPGSSTTAAALVLTRLLAALENPESERSVAERKLIESFASYLRARRTWIAQDALAAYGAWNVANTWYKSRQQQGQLQGLVYYGTVPPDFHSLALANSLALGALDNALGIATGSLPVIGDVISLALTGVTSTDEFGTVDSVARLGGQTAAATAVGLAVDGAVDLLATASKKALAGNVKALGTAVGSIMQSGKLGSTIAFSGRSVAATAGSAGPQIIVGAALIIAEIAIDQAIEINNAKVRLQTAIATAKQNPDLDRMARSEAGVAEMMTQWSFAITGSRSPAKPFLTAYTAAAREVLKNAEPAPVVAGGGSGDKAGLPRFTLKSLGTGTCARLAGSALSLAACDDNSAAFVADGPRLRPAASTESCVNGKGGKLSVTSCGGAGTPAQPDQMWQLAGGRITGPIGCWQAMGANVALVPCSVHPHQSWGAVVIP